MKVFGTIQFSKNCWKQSTLTFPVVKLSLLLSVEFILLAMPEKSIGNLEFVTELTTLVIS